jgi:hypothetical protein
LFASVGNFLFSMLRNPFSLPKNTCLSGAIGCSQEPKIGPREQKMRWLDSWAPSKSWPACASKHPPHRPNGYHRFERFHGPSAWGAQREASPACPGKEHETPRCFHACVINSPHRSTSPLSLTLSMSSHSPPQTYRWFFSRRWEVHRRMRPCFITACPPPQLLHGLPCIIIRDQASLHRSDFNCQHSAMSVSPQITLNPHILQLIYLFIVRRRTLANMHSGSARVRVQYN